MPTANLANSKPPSARTHQVITTKTVITSDYGLAIAAINNLGQVATSAAWPIAAVVIASLFRSDLSGIMQRLREFSGLGIHANLDALIQELPPADPDTASTTPDNGSPQTELLAGSPVDAVITSWLRVDAALNRFLDLDPVAAAGTSFKTKLSKIQNNNSIPTSLKALIVDLNKIRDRVGHSQVDISSDSVKLYVANADKASNELSRITRES